MYFSPSSYCFLLIHSSIFLGGLFLFIIETSIGYIPSTLKSSNITLKFRTIAVLVIFNTTENVIFMIHVQTTFLSPPSVIDHIF